MKQKLFNNEYIAFAVMFISSVAIMCLFTQTTPGLSKLPLFIIPTGVVLFVKRKEIDMGNLKIRTRNDAGFIVAAIIITVVEMMLFCSIWIRKDFSPISGFAQHHNMKIWVMGLTVVLGAVAIPAMSYYLKRFVGDYLNAGQNVIRKYSYMNKTFIILAVIFCVSIMTIIRADYIYKDDMQRLDTGETVYYRESRFLAEFMSMFLHMDKYYADVSPLTQILEMIVMAAVCVIIYVTINPGKKPDFYEIAALVPFALTPYFLEGVSFKFDPPQHAMAVLFAVIPFLYMRNDRKKYIILTVICIPLSCMFHQVPMAFYASVVLLVCLLEWNRKEKPVKQIAAFAGQSAAAYLIGLLIYRVGILNASELCWSTMLSPGDMPGGIIANYRMFFNCILEDFSVIWLLLIAALSIAFIAVLTIKSDRKKLPALGINILGFAGLLLLSYSLYPLLETPLASPRHLYAFGLFVGLISITAVSKSELKSITGVGTRCVAILLAMCFMTFAFSYGNALSQQKAYTEYRVEMVLDTLTEITSENPDETYTVRVEGTTGYAPPIDKLPERYNMTRRLVTTSCNDYFNCWGANGLTTCYGLNITYDPVIYTEKHDKSGMTLYQDNYYQTVYVKDRFILVILKDR